MSNALFSTYSQGENQVTGTFMSVLENISSQLAEDILESIMDESDLSLVSFENQITGVNSVPDGRVKGSSAIWFETKTERNAVRVNQLKNHLDELDEDEAEFQRLIALTPDAEKPDKIEEIDDPRLVWTNFDSVISSIESILERDRTNSDLSVAIPTERESYILRELERFLYDQDLVSGEEDRVLVAAASKAWPEYQEFSLYFCQPNRSFKPSNHLAFYTDGEIKTEVPKIAETVETIELTTESVENNEDIPETFKEKLLSALEEMGSDHYRYSKSQKVMMLEDDLELAGQMSI